MDPGVMLTREAKVPRASIAIASTKPNFTPIAVLAVQKPKISANTLTRITKVGRAWIPPNVPFEPFQTCRYLWRWFKVETSHAFCDDVFEYNLENCIVDPQLVKFAVRGAHLVIYLSQREDFDRSAYYTTVHFGDIKADSNALHCG
ncbi:MAG: hypothetical protein WAN43_03930 [Rhodomicrobium sp.]